MSNNVSLTVDCTNRSTKESALSFYSIPKKRTLLRQINVRCGLRPSDEQTGTSRNGHLTEFLGKLFAVITLFQVCFTFKLKCTLSGNVGNVMQKLITLHVYIDVILRNIV